MVLGMKTLNIHEAKTQLSSLLQQIDDNDTSFVICKNGKPIATLCPFIKGDRTQTHTVMSDFTIDYDPTETLSNEEWPPLI